MKRTLTPSEHAIQSAFVEWCRLNEKKYPGLDLAFAVPNGARTSASVAKRLKAEGMRAGVPDWWLPAPREYPEEVWCGLVIEFKSKRGALSKEQKDYRDKLCDEGWRYEVCRTTEHAIQVVRDYYGDVT